MKCEIIKKNYQNGFWNDQMVAIAVVKGIITKEQYYEITGHEYSDYLSSK